MREPLKRAACDCLALICRRSYRQAPSLRVLSFPGKVSKCREGRRHTAAAALDSAPLNRPRLNTFAGLSATPPPNEVSCDYHWMTSLKLGSLLSDRYSLIRVLGSGTGSTVYLAADVHSDGKQVAIKVVGGTERGEVLQEFFEREVAVLSVVRHSNVIRLLDHGLTPDGQPWLVLEYAEGGSLGEVKNRARFRTEPGITRLLQKCTAGLLQAHLEGVLHRDLKPSNILFDADRRPKLADFNVSKLIGRARSLQTLRHFFTVRYASPEQRLGRAATEKSDVYSLGLIAAELMIGDDSDDVAEVIRRISTVEMSGSLKRLVNVMLSEEPDRRPTTPQLLAELNDLAAHHRILPPVYFRLTEGAAQQIANIQGPGVTVAVARQIVTEDLQTPLLLDLGRSHVEGESPSFVWVGQRFVYFTRPNNASYESGDFTRGSPLSFSAHFLSILDRRGHDARDSFMWMQSPPWAAGLLKTSSGRM